MFVNLFEVQVRNFIQHLKKKKYSKSTIQGYQAGIKQFIQYLVDQSIYQIKTLQTKDINSYQQMIKNKKYTQYTIHHKLRGVEQFLKYLYYEHQIFNDLSKTIIYPKLNRRLPLNILTLEEVERLMQTPDPNTILGLRDRTILELLYSSGIRREECSKLKINDADYKGGYLRVNLGKGFKDRVIPLGKNACYYLKEYLMKVRPRLSLKHEALFLTNDGRKLSLQSIGVIVKKYGRRAGILKQVSPHTLRRSCATHLLKNGAHPIYVQQILGHSRVSVLDRYLQVENTDLKETHHKTHPREKDHAG